MKLFFHLLTFGGPGLVLWTIGKALEQVKGGETQIRMQLMERQEEFERGEITEEQYIREESILLEQLNVLRQG